jgi:hypothetical protein
MPALASAGVGWQNTVNFIVQGVKRNHLVCSPKKNTDGDEKGFI